MSANPFPPGYNNNLFQFGRATALPADIERIVWNSAGVYNGILTSEKSLSVVSTSDLDKVGGGGATQLVFQYQGEDGLEKVGITPTNGLTPVDIPAILAEVSYGAWAIGGEDLDTLGGANKGNIICYETGTPANVLWRISIGEGRTLMCFYRVPSNKSLSLEKVKVFPQGGKPTVMRLRLRTNKAYPWRVQGIADVLDTPVDINIENLPQVIRPGAYIALTAKTSIVNTEVSGYFTGELKDYPGANHYDGLVPF